jgi:agmatine deiminase
MPAFRFTRRDFLGTTALAGLGVVAGCGSDPAADPETPLSTVLTTPKADGFRMPGEWEAHSGCLMAFPTPQNWEGCWRGEGGPKRCNWLEIARKDWAAAAKTVAQFEPVTMLANLGEGDLARAACGTGIQVLEFPLNDAWTRDSGPLWLKDAHGRTRLGHFSFNGWGNKFPPWNDDAALAGRLAGHWGLGLYGTSLVGEGGAISVDGEGTILTTEQCLMNPNRNPGRTKAQVESDLCELLGGTKVIWLAKGLSPDPITDGHVDGICVFARPGTVVLQRVDDPSDPNAAITADARKRLEAATDAQGRKLEIIDMPVWPPTLTYLNFYLANGGVVVPAAGDPAYDEPAFAVLRKAFPDRKVVGVVGEAIAAGGGGIHCITQQMG